MLLIQDLSFRYDKKSILNNISLRVAQGEIVTLIGSSGSGKTTLFKLLAGTLRPCAGTLSIDHSHIAYMTQEDLLLPWRTVLENLLLVGELGSKKENFLTLRQEALTFLHEVGLAGWENAFPDQLSGGMRQRVSLARALLQKRPVLLLDEPFAALDVITREHMHVLLKDIRKRHGTTILMATHDFRDAQAISDRVALIRNGSIVCEWHIDEDHRHTSEKAQKLICQMREALQG